METVLRAAFAYVFILLGLRVMGKREFAQLSPLELVILLLIPEIFSQAIVRDDFSMTNAVIAISTLFGIVYISSIAHHLSRKFSTALEGKPTVLVHHGQFVAPNLNLERVTPDEVYSQMRKSGVDRIEQVEWAILETDGKISIVPEAWAMNPAAVQSRKDLAS